MHRQFAFEAGSDCLPMSVKRKLDRLAIKIGRDQWLGMNSDEKTSILLKLYRLMHEAMPPTAISPRGELVAERSV